MATDLFDFVDSRVTLSEHPLNASIRDAFQLKFSEPRNELQLQIGREGLTHRLVNRHNQFEVLKKHVLDKINNLNAFTESIHRRG